ncbi:Uncharacterized protein Fot_24708 [Forsythia ovata]|uniref:Uncharacterized protein n=1 Tax=Forsythia ovata TaxID=205694 RepID=A0ABD1U6Z1_9LAMI
MAAELDVFFCFLMEEMAEFWDLIGGKNWLTGEGRWAARWGGFWLDHGRQFLLEMADEKKKGFLLLKIGVQTGIPGAENDGGKMEFLLNLGTGFWAAVWTKLE